MHVPSQSIKKLTLLVLVFVFAIGFGARSTATWASPAKQDQMLADSGFRPDPNGFGFENYGNDGSPVNLTADDVRALFGDQVCGSLQDNKCTLIPPAQQWMDEINNAMNGGHCDGMAALSLLMYSGKIKPSDYGQDSSVALPFKNDDKLTRAIAYYWATQTTAPTYLGIVQGTPNEIVDKLIDALKNNTEQYVVSIRKRDNTGGHAITPYAVVDKGNDIVWIMVYDNNFPKTERHIEVNRKANTWQYIASTNPSEPAGLYEGDADTKTLRLKPNSPRLQQQTCDFCQTTTSRLGGLADAAPQYNEIMLDPHQDDNQTDLLITDDQGHRLGFQGGKFYSEISGAQEADVDSADLFTDDPSPVYRIPVGIKFTVTVDGSQIQKPEMSDLTMLGPGYDLAIEDIKVNPGESDTVTFSPDGKQISYKPSSDETPNLIVGFEHAGPDYEFTVKGAAIPKGATIDVTLDQDNGRLGIHTSDSTEAATYGLNVSKIDDNGESIFNHDGLTLDPAATVYVEYAKWDGKGDMPLSISSKSDGTIDSTATAPNSGQ